MNLRVVILVVISLGAAGGTAKLVSDWMETQRAAARSVPSVAEAPKPAPMVEILVAGRDLGVGTFLRAEHLQWKKWPAEGLSTEFMVKDKRDPKDLEGAVVRSRLVAGEPITAFRVVHPGEQGFLAAVLDPAKRAVSVPVDATSGIAGFVFPGDLVDVLLSFKVKEKVTEGGERTRYFSETLLENIRVLAIDQRIESSDGVAKVPKTATLEVTPKQAERITIGLQVGALALSLRGLTSGDDTTADNGAELEAPAFVPVMATLPAEDGQSSGSYTRDVDVFYMWGHPLGIAAPDSKRPSVLVMRGGKSESVALGDASKPAAAAAAAEATPTAAE
jgi:pilus assembly protein CpaB